MWIKSIVYITQYVFMELRSIQGCLKLQFDFRNPRVYCVIGPNQSLFEKLIFLFFFARNGNES